MSAAFIVEAIREDGLEILLDGRDLKLRGRAATIQGWSPLLAPNKLALVEYFADFAIAHHWVLHFATRGVVHVHISPAKSNAEVLAQYPDALTAEPVPALAKALPSCADCVGYRRHGESGYCCVRQDLPAAYGERHPLRMIPNAGVCGKWVSRIEQTRLSETAGDLQ